MELKILDLETQKIAEIISDEVIINNTQDALDLMATVDYEGASGFILHVKNLNRDFFDLRTGLAGEISQKYATYRMKLAIIGDFETFKSKSLQAFILECNRGKLLFFVPDIAAARIKLSH